VYGTVTMSSYETAADFGTLYDAVPAYAARADVAFYVAEATRVARESRATVLELGCGTGRVLLPLARAGHDVTGIDASAAMLARCRAKLAREPASVPRPSRALRRRRPRLYAATVAGAKRRYYG